MTDDPMLTPEYQAKIRVARRIAIAVSVVVGLIFTVAGVLGYFHLKYDLPAKYFFDPSLDPANAPKTERDMAPMVPKPEATP